MEARCRLSQCTLVSPFSLLSIHNRLYALSPQGMLFCRGLRALKIDLPDKYSRTMCAMYLLCLAIVVVVLCLCTHVISVAPKLHGGAAQSINYESRFEFVNECAGMLDTARTSAS